jgi:hypothetical protein
LLRGLNRPVTGVPGSVALAVKGALLDGFVPLAEHGVEMSLPDLRSFLGLRGPLSHNTR